MSKIRKTAGETPAPQSLRESSDCIGFVFEDELYARNTGQYKMRKMRCLSFLAAMLLAGAASVVCAAARPPAAQTATKKKSVTSKSKKKKTPAKPKGQMAPTADRIKEIQTALQREGAYQGEPNGKWDAATIEAMKSYQNKNGLSSTGKIDALTLGKLGLGSETAGKGAPVPPASSTPKPATDSAQ